MKFSLVFENTGDSMPFEVVHNHELFEFFVSKSISAGQNQFNDNNTTAQKITKSLAELHWALSNTNEILHDLVGINFSQDNNLENYLDQHLLNRMHAEWVASQKHMVPVHQLRFSQNSSSARLGQQLHDQFPDEISETTLSVAMQHLGRILPYEEVNMAIHRLENIFSSNIEFNAGKKWDIFDNPYKTSMTSSQDRVNFFFGYTYVGRQLHNKFEYFDMNLECNDHYNYETLEYSFNINLQQPETIEFSPEFLSWCKQHNRQPMASQIPIANIIDLTKHLTLYRKMLYNNSQQRNSASIILH